MKRLPKLAWLGVGGLLMVLSGCGIVQASGAPHVPSSWATVTAQLGGKTVSVRLPKAWARYRWTGQFGEVIWTEKHFDAAVPNVMVTYSTLPQTPGVSSFRINGQYVLSEGGGPHDRWGIQVTVPNTSAYRAQAHLVIGTWRVKNA